MGFDYCAYLLVSSGIVAEKIYCDMPPAFGRAYAVKNLRRNDPIFHLATQEDAPFAWSELLCNPALSAAAHGVLDEYRKYGVLMGVTMPFPLSDSERNIVSIARRAAMPYDVLAVLPECYLVTAYMTAHLRKLRRQVAASGDRLTLTQRERECLYWTRFGKTIKEVGLIVGVSRKTVEFHLGNAKRKLGVTSKTLAVVRAIERGELASKAPA
jgi:DNA-binding CsgD family transcriptional regulator